MARYTEAVCRLCRREGEKLFLKGERCYTPKCSFEKRSYAPGMHGKMNAGRPGRESFVRPRVEVVRRGAYPLPVDALRVHRGQASLDRGQLREALADHAPRGLQARQAVPAQLQVGRGLHVLGHPTLDLGVQAGHQEVGVDVGDLGRTLLRDAHARAAVSCATPNIRPPMSASRTPSSCH